MPIVISQNKRIHYEIEGDKGPFLILHPPFMVSIDNWYRSEYIEPLEKHFRLVLMEPMGQGNSDTPPELSYYLMESMLEHLFSITKELQIDSFHFFGMGIGAQLGFMLAAHYPQYLRSLTTIGAHPYPLTTEIPTLEEDIRQLQSGNIAEYLQQRRSGENLSPEQQEEIKKGSAQAYALTLQASAQWEGIGQHLDSIMTPGLLFTVTSEEKFLAIREAGRTMRHARYLILPKFKYSNGLLDAELVVPPLIDFIRRQRWSSTN